MSQFFKFPINYEYDHDAFYLNSANQRLPASQVNDNNYLTFSRQNRFIFETHGDTRTDNSTISHVFIKGKNITQYTISIPAGKALVQGFQIV